MTKEFIINLGKIAFIVLMLFSCQNAKDFQENVVEIEVPGKLEYHSNISDFFSSIDYVLLEDSDENPLVQPYKIISYDSLIFVEDQELDNLLIYNRSGDFLFALNSEGQGPREFNQIEDYQVSENSIIIKDNVLMKFIEFDFSGNYVGETKHQLLSMNFIKRDNFQIHFFNNVIQTKPFNFLTISESDSSYAVPIEQGFENSVLVHQSGFTKSKKSEDFFLSLPFSYDVFNFNSEGHYKQRLAFNLGNLSLTEEERLELESQRRAPYKHEYVRMLRSFYPIEDNFIFNYYTNYEETYLGVLSSDYSLLKIGKNLINDLDGVPLILVPWSYHESGIILKLPSRALAGYIGNRKPVSEIKSNLESFIRVHGDELSNDRHVLVFLNR